MSFYAGYVPDAPEQELPIFNVGDRVEACPTFYEERDGTKCSIFRGWRFGIVVEIDLNRDHAFHDHTIYHVLISSTPDAWGRSKRWWCNAEELRLSEFST